MRVLFYRLIIFVAFSGMVIIGVSHILPQIFPKEEVAAAVERTNGYVEVQGVFFYSESVVYADRRGKIQQSLKSGSRIACGETGAMLESAVTDLIDDNIKVAINAVEPGLLFYKTDGLESVLRSDNIGDISINRVIQEKENYQYQPTSDFCQKGDFVFKTIDNFADPYVGVHFSANPWKTLPIIGDELPCVIEGKKATGRVIYIGAQDGAMDMILQLKANDEWFNQRFVKIGIFTGSIF